MDLPIKYRGKNVTIDDIALVRRLIAQDPQMSRRALSQKLCRHWNWVQANGALRDMVCRCLLLHLERSGYITLPQKHGTPPNPLAHRKKPAAIKIDESPIARKLSEIKPIRIIQVRRSLLEKLFNSLIEQHHYLGYTQPVGEHLKYIVFLQDRPIACFAFSSAPRHIGCRDRFIGWSKELRQKNLHLITYNTRFLIFDWVRIENLASYLLARMAKTISDDWEKNYHHPIYFLETFVDTERFTGACYKAANWLLLGKTTGRGKNDQTGKANRSIKAVFGYPLVKDFRKYLCRP